MVETTGTFPNLQSPLVNIPSGTVTTAWYRLFLKLIGQIQPGSVTLWAGSGTPSGTVLCDGSAISRTTYSSLFNVIGTTYGVGDGSTTFNVPTIAALDTDVNFFIYY